MLGQVQLVPVELLVTHEDLLALCHVASVGCGDKTLRRSVTSRVSRTKHSLTPREVHTHGLVMPIRLVMASGVTPTTFYRGNLLLQLYFLMDESLFRLALCLDDVLFGLELVL